MKTNYSPQKQQSELSYLLDNQLRPDHQYRVKLEKEFLEAHCCRHNLAHPKILDLGCHDGTILKMIVKNNDAELYGVDHSLEYVKRAKANGIKAQVADLNCSLPFPDASKDIIVAGEILEHLYAPELVLNEIHRVLNKNGGLILTVPNICSLRNRIRIFLGKFPMHYNFSANGLWGEHIRIFNSDSLKFLLHNVGFEIKSMTSNGMFGKGLFSKILPQYGDILVIYATKNNSDSIGGNHEQLRNH